MCYHIALFVIQYCIIDTQLIPKDTSLLSFMRFSNASKGMIMIRSITTGTSFKYTVESRIKTEVKENRTSIGLRTPNGASLLHP